MVDLALLIEDVVFVVLLVWVFVRLWLLQLAKVVDLMFHFNWFAALVPLDAKAVGVVFGFVLPMSLDAKACY